MDIKDKLPAGTKSEAHSYHLFLDEAGDTAFYSLHKKVIIGTHERGEIRYYNFLKEKISTITDLYDCENNKGYSNYYTLEKPLTVENMLK